MKHFRFSNDPQLKIEIQRLIGEITTPSVFNTDMTWIRNLHDAVNNVSRQIEELSRIENDSRN